MTDSLQEMPDYHEGYQHGFAADLDNLRDGYSTTPEYCEGYDAGHRARAFALNKKEQG